ncbi:85/88 kDa calcium-independent phospholipase A2-like [Sycon ciliatum]|uniref:85/88 kDa calcium-independent phospholipase A2-like n=1 Tax=Sycon ciliatum TaxID=27933 RepID=UPI0031F647D5
MWICCLACSCSSLRQSGCSPLHLASKYGQTAICTELLDAGADANLRDSRGKLAYHVAHKKLPDAVKERLLKGVNHNASKALTLLNIQVKKSSSASSHKISLSTSKGFIGDGDEGSLGPRNKSSWFKRKSAGATVNTSSMPIFNS